MAEKAERLSQVQKSLELLDSAIRLLRESITTLDTRLCPVLTESPVVTENTVMAAAAEDASSQFVPLAADIRRLTQSVEFATAWVSDLVKRCEV